MDPVSHRVSYSRNRVRDYVLYVLISLALVGTAIVVEAKFGHDAFNRWGGLAGFTAALFGYFIGESRRYFGQRRFWLLIAALLTVHLVAFSILLMHAEEWRSIWFYGMVAEYPILVYLRGRFLPFS